MPSARGSTTWPVMRARGAAGVRRMMARLVTLLPEPLSPTSARVSPARTSSETPRTAGTGPASVWKVTPRSLDA